MIEPRIYRAAFLPAIVAIVLVAFSLEPPPRAIDQGLAADALFDGNAAVSSVRSIESAAPDRRAGGAGDRATAARVASTFRGNGFTTTVDRWTKDGRALENVVGQRAGQSSRTIVVLAARDSDRPPDATASAADTAALMQFAEVFQGRLLHKTLVLASVDAGELGDAGARRFVQRLAEPQQVEAAIVVSDLGAPRARGPLVIGWSNDTTRAGIGLQKTVAGSLREELGKLPSQEGTIAQFVRLALPVAPGGQGVLLEHGLDAVRISGSGEISRGSGGASEIDPDRYGALGRSVLRVISTLDGSRREPRRGERSYLGVGGMVLPAWALELLAIALVLPALVTSVDALARARRRREAVGPWFAWLAANAVPFMLALVVAWFMALVGLIDDAPAAPLDPHAVTLDGTAIAALAATSLVALVAWLALRTRLLRRGAELPDPAAAGAGCSAALAMSVVVFALAFLNPFAALVLVPATHLWLLATLTEVRARSAAVMAAVGVVPIAFVIGFYAWRFGLSPLRGAWYGLLLVTGVQPGPAAVVAGVVLATVTVSVAAIVVARLRHGDPDRPGRDGSAPDAPRPSIFGPGGHAGPGAIGRVGAGRQ